ncbi:laccase [Thozetella sp. PMI_491]|nr:laccase [Thozetella sp. PMI_491]
MKVWRGLVGLLAAAPCNTPANRARWCGGFNVSTDYEKAIPNTGVTRYYHFELTDVDNWIGGDGVAKERAQLINGPVVMADWGDTVKITVTNYLRFNGSSIHWHGIRMLNNNLNDGVNGVTQCPIPPNSSMTYTFRAEQHGTTWYHSHYSTQYVNGVLGTIQINGPASAPYDEDLGVFPVSDWYYAEADGILRSMIPPPGVAPRSDNILFNGTHVNANGTGSYYRVRLKKGKRYRLRILNTSVEDSFSVSLASHNLTVIGVDLVPVQPHSMDYIFMGVGQRYDVIIDASQAVQNYWFNVTFAGTVLCGVSKIDAVSKPAAIFSYDGAPNGLPRSPGTPPPDSRCEDKTDFIPTVSRVAPASSFSAPTNRTLEFNFTTKQWEDQQRVYWQVSNQDMNVTWGTPTLQYLAKGKLDFPASSNVFQVPESNKWSFWVIENVSPVPGHDFLILGRSPAVADPFTISTRYFNEETDVASLNFTNPTRRDSTMLPGFGWVVVAFMTDNPGAWLFHCHIDWHVAQGLSIQFLERVQDIPHTVPLSAIEPLCSQWASFSKKAGSLQMDSGLKL